MMAGSSKATTRRQLLQHELLTPTDIAKICGVGLPAVSNWAKRHEDFPKPALDKPNVTLYFADEVAAWLRERYSGIIDFVMEHAP